MLGPWTETVELITPGTWIDFFRCVSDEYTGIMADDFDTRSTLQVMVSKIHLIQERQYDVIFHPGHQLCVLSRPFITTCQAVGKFVITSIESSLLYGPSVVYQPFTLQSVHQVYHVLDGAINVTIDGEENVVWVGETVFIPAGTQIQVAFLGKYTRFWAFSTGNGLEALVEKAGEAYEGYMVPDKPSEADLGHVREIAKTLDIIFQSR
ncbi:hypothetical protein BO99DRAFT_459855 [Aspergillus violaceofuscus CBS 115571]|uniref:Cupin 2 conserved barrel domain-containing protein n=1 Tax=Aspergillus violaceofuscus (strain CBS 115571) TaxID=1450538 RepID=A0A2V5H9Q6_ASPV1|nr:hypothetical protein BO99DRAFT_459855 [Aspergillus violaceofuscus CBS 115571]